PSAGISAAALSGHLVVKEEPAELDQETSEEISEENGNGRRVNFREIFPNRKKFSVRKRDRKQRLNRHLRKAMIPKNALMNLNEVGGMDISGCNIERSPEGIFVATVTINSLDYVGSGLSKIAAKKTACEKAWRDYIIARMAPKKTAIEKTLEQMDATNGEADPPDSEEPTNDLPMVNLACYAIYKLFGQWESEGVAVPPMVAPPLPDPANLAQPFRLMLPPNWADMLACSLLSMMRPGTSYEDSGTSGKEPNIVHRLSVFVDEMKFIACGRSKKIARYNVAVAACNVLFNTNFEAKKCK
ncbi:hypothetical protein KR018_001727, partial [Drosophila ironensis]